MKLLLLGISSFLLTRPAIETIIVQEVLQLAGHIGVLVPGSKIN